MNTTAQLLCASVVLYGIHAVASTTLTFDTLTTATQKNGEQFSPIPNGYGGLNWDGIDVVNVSTIPQETTGYHTGLISGNNVAFNVNGDITTISSISSKSTFDFISAYLTSASPSPITVVVSAYNFINDKESQESFVITSNAPTLLNFDLGNVTQVSLATANLGGVFVMDNLTVDVPDKPNTLRLLSLIILAGLLCAPIRKSVASQKAR